MFRHHRPTLGPAIKTFVLDMLHPALPGNPAELQPFATADEALGAVLGCLKRAIPFTLWMVTRLDDDDWTVVKSLDDGYQTQPGRMFRWNGTYCSRMAAGEGPMFAEEAQRIEPYRRAPINQELPLPIAAYIGLPLYRARGQIAGTLCALDPGPQKPLTLEQRLLAVTLARSLSTMLMTHVRAEAAIRKAERHRYEAETDMLTGLYNRRGWALALQDQEDATVRSVQNSMVVIIDLDDLKVLNDTQGHDAGDELLRRAAATLRGQFREQDILARIGGDEFAVLVSNVSSREAGRLLERLRASLAAAHVAASIGHAFRLANESMSQTVVQADRDMYEDKARRKSQRPAAA